MFPRNVCRRTSWLAGLMICTAVSAAGAKIEVIRDVPYVERPSGPVTCDVYLPEGAGPFPAVLLVHGGAWKEGNGDKTQLFFVANRLANEGFVTVAINYRLAPTHKFPTQIEDCKAAVRWMRTHAADYHLDPAWIGGWGYSAGGHLVSLLGTTDTSANLDGPDAAPDAPSARLQAVVAGGTPCDFRVFPLEDDNLAYWLGGTRSQQPAAYDKASPQAYITHDDPPIFLYHGVADELVPVDQASGMAAEFERAGVVCELYLIPKAKHIGAALDMKALSAGVKFLHAQRNSAVAVAPATEPTPTAAAATVQ